MNAFAVMICNVEVEESKGKHRKLGLLGEQHYSFFIRR